MNSKAACRRRSGSSPCLKAGASPEPFGEDAELGGLTWRHLNLPALAEENDLLGREVGEPLWPKRFNLRRLLGMRAANEYDFEALYQQRPRKRGGSVFSDRPVRWEQEERGGKRLVIAVDTASSKRTTADYQWSGQF